MVECFQEEKLPTKLERNMENCKKSNDNQQF